MQIEKININKIIPYENNSKIHTPEQIEQIKKSIKEFGNNDPICIDENNVIIEGHGRLLALKELGYKEVEIIKLSCLTEEQKRAYALIHNKLTINTGFNIDTLSIELDNILNIDMSNFDFFNIEPIEINQDYEQEEHITKKLQLYLNYKNKHIPISEEEEQTLDDLIERYVNEKGVLYGFINEVIKHE